MHAAMRALMLLAVLAGMVTSGPAGEFGARAAQLSQGTLNIDPAQGLPHVEITATPDFGAGPDCAVEWDGSPVAAAGCGPGSVAGKTFELDAIGPPGEHTITVCRPACTDAQVTASAQFLVLTVVPALDGLALGGSSGAESAAKNADLTLHTVGGSALPGAVVAGQDPQPGAVVDPGTVVGITLAPVTARSSTPRTGGRGVTSTHPASSSRASPSIAASASAPAALIGAAPASHDTALTWALSGLGAALLAIVALVLLALRPRRPRARRTSPPTPRAHAVRRDGSRRTDIDESPAPVHPAVELRCTRQVSVAILEIDS